VIKRHDILRRATPETLPDDTMKVLEDIRNYCPLAKISSVCPSFQVHFLNEVVFNQELLLDIYRLEKKISLSIPDSGTGFLSLEFPGCRERGERV
jgi:hypothetical protein